MVAPPGISRNGPVQTAQALQERRKQQERD